VNAWRAASLAAQFGATVVGCIAGGVALGIWADVNLGSAPAFLLVGVFAGVAASLYLLVAIYRLQDAPRPPRQF
jgi:F0F1-type ATP synthase assembly protein I